MPTPFSSLLHSPYAQEEIQAIIAKYPHINTHAANMSSGSPHPQAIAVSPGMLAELDAIAQKILNCVKEDMKGSADDKPGHDNWGNVYPTAIHAEYAMQSRPSPHGGFPGCQWAFETSPAGQLCLKVTALYGVCAKAQQFRIQKEAQERAAKEKEAAAEEKKKRHRNLFDTNFPILKEALVFKKFDRRNKTAQSIGQKKNEDLRVVGDFYMHFCFHPKKLEELSKKVDQDAFWYITTKAMVAMKERIDSFCQNDYKKQKIDAEVERRLSKKKFDEEVERELKRRAGAANLEEFQKEIDRYNSLLSL
jgi:hypothetical protein